MKLPLLLLSLLAGALLGWLSIVGGIWFLMPVFLICAGIVAIKLDAASRWRIAAFGVGLLVVFALQANQFIQTITQTHRELKDHKVTISPQFKTPPRAF